MLRNANSLKYLALGLSLMTSAAYGQETEARKDESTFTAPYFEDTPTNRKAVDDGRQLGESMVKDILNAYQTLPTPSDVQSATSMARRADDIANPALAKDRNKILEFLGINPQSDTALYYFVSWSMPLEMLRSYAIEAMWTGGTLVFKGVPPGKELGKFMVTELRSLVYGKGASANLSIDPRLYEAYEVKSVPTIVFTTTRANMQCQGSASVTVKANGKEGVYEACPALDPASYWKVTGTVTTSYALEAFIDDGALLAKPYLTALSKGWREGTAPGNVQVPFTGEWKDAVSPADMMRIQQALAQKNAEVNVTAPAATTDAEKPTAR